MLILVVDANILFSFFKLESATKELITRFELLKLHSPELALEELIKCKKLICKKSGLEESLKILRLFVIFETQDSLKEFLPKAKKVSPDIDDAVYFSLALKLNCGIWSNEKRLKKQPYVKVISTKELIELLEK